MWSASNRRASSLVSRARFNETSGNTPSASIFSIFPGFPSVRPPSRCLSCHPLWPSLVTSRYPAFLIEEGFQFLFRGFAFFDLNVHQRHWRYSTLIRNKALQMPPGQRRPRTAAAVSSDDFQEFSGFPRTWRSSWMSSEDEMVEAARNSNCDKSLSRQYVMRS